METEKMLFYIEGKPDKKYTMQEVLALICSDWSNDTCLGYVLKAMEDAGFQTSDIEKGLLMLHVQFDRYTVEEAEHYYKHHLL